MHNTNLEIYIETKYLYKTFTCRPRNNYHIMITYYRLFLFLSFAVFTVASKTNLRIYPVTKNELYRMYNHAITKFNVSSEYKRNLLYMWENVVRSALNGLHYYETTITYPLLLDDHRFLKEFYSYFPDCRIVIDYATPHEKNPYLVKIRLEW